MEIQNYNVKELSLVETLSLNGGTIKVPKWVKRGGLVGIGAGILIENWSDIKQGIVDGWNDAMSD